LIARTSTFKSSDGTPLFVYEWRPQTPPRGIVHIAHGLGEHGERYAHVGRALAAEGYAVYVNDHRGHGRTAKSAEELGLLARRRGWERVIEDLRLLIQWERTVDPGIPVILLGHSMGSFMAQCVAFQCEEGFVQGLILSGSSGKPPLKIRMLRLLANAERLRLGKRGRSELLHRLSLREANRMFMPVRTDFDWLTRNQAEVDRFVADPLCGFVATTQLWIDMFRGLFRAARGKNRGRIFPKNLPIYIFAGTEDPISGNCETLEELIAGYHRVGLRNVRYKFYQGGRHEMLNELNRDSVLHDLISWLHSVVPRRE
jgi:alpha-beta hydrolase superfamily lysophospholipase